MAYSFINSAFGALGSTNNATVTTTTSLTVLQNDLIISAFFSGDATGNTISDGGSNSYTAATSTNSNLFFYYCLATAPGTYTVSGNASLGHGHAVAAFQYRGLNAFQGANAGNQAGTGSNGANVINFAGNVTATAAPAMVWGLAMDVTNYNNAGSGAAPTAGTSPLAFTGRGTFWLNGAGTLSALSEDFRITSTGTDSMTAGTNSQFNTFYAAVMIFTEAPSGSLLVGQNSPTSGGTNNLSGGAGGMFWHVFTATTTGIATSLGIYINSVGGSNGLNLALYDVITGALIASGSPTLATGLCSVPINAIIIAGRPYALVYQGGANNGSIIVADDGTNNQVLFATNTAGSFPSKLPAGGGPTNLGVPSIFVNGTPNPTAASIPYSSTQFFTQDRLLVN